MAQAQARIPKFTVVPIQLSKSAVIFGSLAAIAIGLGIPTIQGEISIPEVLAFEAAFPTGTVTQLGYGVAIVAGVYLSVAAHEMGHAYVAQWFGYEVDEISITTFGGTTQINLNDCDAMHMAIIVAAGPVTNFAVFAIFSVQSVFFGYLGSYILATFFLTIASFNLVLVLLNLFPTRPLDGGEMIHAGVRHRYSTKTADRASLIIGMVFGILLLGYSAQVNWATGVALGLVVFGTLYYNHRYTNATTTADSSTFGESDSVCCAIDSGVADTRKERIRSLLRESEHQPTNQATHADILVVPDGDKAMFKHIGEQYGVDLLESAAVIHQLEGETVDGHSG